MLPLQVQFVGQCVMLAGSMALQALLQPSCAARLSSQQLSRLVHVPSGLGAADDCAAHDLARYGRRLWGGMQLP